MGSDNPTIAGFSVPLCPEDMAMRTEITSLKVQTEDGLLPVKPTPDLVGGLPGELRESVCKTGESYYIATEKFPFYLQFLADKAKNVKIGRIFGEYKKFDLDNAWFGVTNAYLELCEVNAPPEIPIAGLPSNEGDAWVVVREPLDDRLASQIRASVGDCIAEADKRNFKRVPGTYTYVVKNDKDLLAEIDGRLQHVKNMAKVALTANGFAKPDANPLINDINGIRYAFNEKEKINTDEDFWDKLSLPTGVGFAVGGAAVTGCFFLLKWAWNKLKGNKCIEHPERCFSSVPPVMPYELGGGGPTIDSSSNYSAVADEHVPTFGYDRQRIICNPNCATIEEHINNESSFGTNALIGIGAPFAAGAQALGLGAIELAGWLSPAGELALAWAKK